MVMLRRLGALGARIPTVGAYHAMRLSRLVWQASACVNAPLGVGTHQCMQRFQCLVVFP